MKALLEHKISHEPTKQLKKITSPKIVREDLEIIETKDSYKIFYVDDSIMIRKSLWRVFNDKQNLIQMSFATGEEFIEYIDEKPEIVILDYHLTETLSDKTIMNGLDVLEKIRMMSPETKVIMLSSQNDISVAVDCLKKGANDYLVKDKVMRINVKRAVNDVIQSFELEKEIVNLSSTIKRDKLMIKGYFAIIIMLVLLVGYLFLS